MRDALSFNAVWLAETLRIKELRDGALEDTTQVARALGRGGSFAQRLVARAQGLAERENIQTTFVHWRALGKLAFAVMAIAAILTGAGLAAGALGDGTRPVNLMLAIALLLGLHTLTFIFWLIGTTASSSHASGLGTVWLWMTARMARTPQSTAAGQALVATLQRSQGLKPMLGMLTHAVWSVAFVAALLTLLALLSARQYVFQWETTLLAPDTFATITRLLGGLPSLIGFPVPADTVVSQSMAGALPANIGAGPIWSQWLLGVIVAYGFVPRFLALLACVITWQRRMQHLTLDTTLPGFIELKPRLMPGSLNTGIDAPAPDLFSHPREAGPSRPMTPGGHNALVALELPNDITWPPSGLETLGTDLGRVDTREQRHTLLSVLESKQYDHLIAACDGRLTPDRGTLLYFQALAQTCKQFHVLILLPDTMPENNRTTLWQANLERAGFDGARVYTGPANLKAQTGITLSTPHGNH
ncbi:DUF2868 domain-containing protein [Pusillimonas minor]|uniref:DUF2868 domain-containing protein n=1 Tax=Pusillimonas minor TaxID=2697024 RepID=A0A842HMN1_9BURK|nr:DUF2868 domain-containing protein [Pusillimonas minor]MBC2768982.1 DUF2868 domain-containing protein [Pusillimonas minor]